MRLEGGMKKATSNILIIGGGVAGMAAAQTLADLDVALYLVGKKILPADMLPSGRAWQPTPAKTAVPA
jgi:2-polyprenyl-6-methoxyphenol hydroxylase-like FAD-dependent oxidoreductase